MHIAYSPCQIQLLALRDVHALDPHGRDVCWCDVRTSGERASASVVDGRQGHEEGGPVLAAGC